MTAVVTIDVVQLPHGTGLPLPAYETAGAAGMDLLAAVDTDLMIAPGERIAVPTGLAMAIPDGYEVQVRPRSGLAIKHGITAINTPGTIDCDYRGEVKVLLVNLGQVAVTISRGMRIAQMIVAPVSRGTWRAVDNLPETRRGTGGFGSTGS